MAGSLNRAMIIGNVGRDPETRHFQSGGMVTNFSVATSESWRDKQTGEKRERTQWHNIAIFNENLAKIAQEWIKKGSKVYIEGQIETRKWQDQSGHDRYSTEIVLRPFNGAIVLLGDPKGSQVHSDYGSPAPVSSGAASAGSTADRNPYDDEIPF